jgi:hypothetical protein
MATIPISMALDVDLGWMEEYGRDYDYFRANYNDLCRKHKNEFVAIKNLKIYHDANPLKLITMVLLTLITLS